MNGTRRSTKALCAVAAGVLVATGTACTARDRAGGEADADVIVLSFAQPNDGDPPPQLAAWADEVRSASGGSLEIEFENGWRIGEPRYESGTIEDIRAGEIDMGWVGARALDRAGITSFQALLAPMLVDSQALQRAVFDEGIPAEMLAAVNAEEDGVVGVGALPGPLRKLLGTTRPFDDPADFSGATIGMQDSVLAEATFKTLGATASALASGAQDLSGVDAYEQQLSSIWGNQYQEEADYLTGDLNLWPRPLVLLVSASSYDGLTGEQQEALVAAGTSAVEDAATAAAAEDADAVEFVCGSGLVIAPLTDDQRDRLETAVAPVHEQLRVDPESRDWLARIEALKRELDQPADGMDCAAEAAGASASGDDAVEGEYQMRVHWPDVDTGDCPPGGEEGTADEVIYDLALRDGKLDMKVRIGGPDAPQQFGVSGDYTVFRDRFELVAPGLALSMNVDVDDEALRFSDLEGGECGDATIMTSLPWRRVDPEPTARGIDGSWTARITAADWGPEAGPIGTFTMTFIDGAMTLTDPAGEVGFFGDYVRFRDRLEITGGPDNLRATVVIDGDEMVFRDLRTDECIDCGPYEVVWESHPWVRE